MQLHTCHDLACAVQTISMHTCRISNAVFAVEMQACSFFCIALNSKNFITNLRRKRKKSARLEQTTTEEPPVIEEPAAIEELPAIEEPPSKRRLRALTHPSSYNLFHRDCIRSAG